MKTLSKRIAKHAISRLVREQHLPVQNARGDRGFHSVANEEFLESHGIRSGLCPRNVTDLTARLENEPGTREEHKRRA